MSAPTPPPQPRTQATPIGRQLRRQAQPMVISPSERAQITVVVSR